MSCGCWSPEHSDEQCDDAFHDYGVGVGFEVHTVFLCEVCVDPYAALATFYEVLRSLVFFVDWRKRVAEVYYVGISVHPIVYVGELVDYFVLDLIYSHSFLNILGMTRFLRRRGAKRCRYCRYCQTWCAMWG